MPSKTALTLLLFPFQSAQKIFGGEVKTHLLLFTDDVNKESDNMKAYNQTAKLFKGKVSSFALFYDSTEAAI